MSSVRRATGHRVASPAQNAAECCRVRKQARDNTGEFATCLHGGWLHLFRPTYSPQIYNRDIPQSDLFARPLYL